MTRIASFFIVILLVSSAAKANVTPKILFKNYLIHTVSTPDNVGLKVLELLGPRSTPMSSARPIVLMHGFTSNWHNWHLVADSYRQAGLRVFIVNWRGHGQGQYQSIPLDSGFDTHDERFSFHNLAVYDVPTVIDFAFQKSNGKKVIYQSHSMGGMMANLAFAGVTRGSDGKITISTKVGKSYESKVFAYIPVAAPNSLKFKEMPGSNILYSLMRISGINGDLSNVPTFPFERFGYSAMYNFYKFNGLMNGLMNLDQMSKTEFEVCVKLCASDVPKAMTNSMFDMQETIFGSEDRSIDYAAISQALPGTFYYKTRIPTLMISAVTDSLALIELQDGLAMRRGTKHIRLSKAGHMDIIVGTPGAKRVISETLQFIQKVPHTF